jgi:3-phenylpropionate/trans-cinnamate dioxygenase ferredoxin reductase component
VIAGAGLAGAKAAETLRSQGFEGRVVLVGDAAARPCGRPPLSKDYLRGEKEFEAAALHEQGFYDANGIELLTSTMAESFDRRPSEVVLSTGERLGYDRGRRGLTCSARESSRAATRDALRAHGQYCGPVSPGTGTANRPL